jgi:hypothetical protein
MPGTRLPSQLLANFLGQPCSSTAFSQQKKDHLNEKYNLFLLENRQTRRQQIG